MLFKKLSFKPLQFSNVLDHMRKCGFSLYDYQKECVKWMLDREINKKRVKGGLLCHEPGL